MKMNLYEADKVDFITNKDGVVVKIMPREDCKVIEGECVSEDTPSEKVTK